jgi:hypothetical protein
VKHTVLPVNSDQIDKLEFVAHISAAVRALIHRGHRRTFRFVSEPCCAPAGGSGATPPNRSPSTLCEAAETDARGSTVVGMAVYRVAGLEIRSVHHESLHGARLAP